MTQSSDRPPGQVTQWLLDWNVGDDHALDELAPLVDAELRRLARTYLRSECRGSTLQTTALINEAFIRLIVQKRTRWVNSAHFFGIAARSMRRVLVDYARRRCAAKRGGGMRRVSPKGLDTCSSGASLDPTMILAVHEKLTELEALDARQAGIVELKFFGGMTDKEISALMGISVATIRREWDMARTWLRQELGELDPHDKLDPQR